MERLLVQGYARQLDEARAALEQAAARAVARPGDPVARQELAAAEENYATAARLAQSYDVVARTMTAQPIAVAPPAERSPGIGSVTGRLGAAVAIALLVGIVGALAVDRAARDRPGAAPVEPIDARPSFGGPPERRRRSSSP